MSIAVFLSIPILCAFLLYCLATRKPAGRDLVLNLSIALGLGLGVSSATYFLWSALFNPGNRLFLVIELCLLLVVVAIVIRHRKAVFGGSRNWQHKEKPAGLLILLAAFLCTAAGLACLSAVVTSAHGTWDAWAIWNLRARFIFRGGDYWTNGFSEMLFGHPDYPLFIPASVARIWTSIGNDTEIVPALISVLFTGGTVGLIYGFLKKYRLSETALLASSMMLANPMFIELGVSQCADVPLGFFTTCALILLLTYEREKDSVYLALFGLSLALGAWVKNEGLVISIAFLLPYVVYTGRMEGIRRCAGKAGIVLSGFLPVFLVVVLFKVGYAPGSTYVEGQEFPGSLWKALDLARHGSIWRAFLDTVLSNSLVGFPLIVVIALLVRFQPKRSEIALFAMTLSVFAAVLVAYYLIYLLYPFELGPNMDQSIHRLGMHIWPAFVLWFFFFADLGRAREAAVEHQGGGLNGERSAASAPS